MGSLAVFYPAAPMFAQQAAAPADTSRHTMQFIGVDNNVTLEVLDLGGSGKPLVLVAGLGGTAHDFDRFAPRLTGVCHVYGINAGDSAPPARPFPQVKTIRLIDRATTSWRCSISSSGPAGIGGAFDRWRRVEFGGNPESRKDCRSYLSGRCVFVRLL
jgi:hypothetical protein